GALRGGLRPGWDIAGSRGSAAAHGATTDRQVDQPRNSSISARKAFLGREPERVLTSSPPEETLIVGMETMPYFAVVAGVASTARLRTSLESACSWAISAGIGATC